MSKNTNRFLFCQRIKHITLQIVTIKDEHFLIIYFSFILSQMQKPAPWSHQPSPSTALVLGLLQWGCEHMHAGQSHSSLGFSEGNKYTKASTKSAYHMWWMSALNTNAPKSSHAPYWDVINGSLEVKATSLWVIVGISFQLHACIPEDGCVVAPWGLWQVYITHFSVEPWLQQNRRRK